MVQRSVPTTTLDSVFSALGDPTRRAILAKLAQGESPVTELAAPHEMSLPAVSKHIKILESAGLVMKEKDGRVVRCRLNPSPLKVAADWVGEYRQFWEGQLEQLARYLGESLPTTSKEDE